MNLYGIKVWCCTTFYHRATVGHNHLSFSTHEFWKNFQSWSLLHTVDREVVHQVSSQEREVGHQWTRLITKSFLARTFLVAYCRSWTSTPGKFPGKRGGSPMDALKYQVFPRQNIPRHVLLHYYALYPVTRITSLLREIMIMITISQQI